MDGVNINDMTNDERREIIDAYQSKLKEAVDTLQEAYALLQKKGGGKSTGYPWVDTKKVPLEKLASGIAVEIRYYDSYNVTRTATGVNGYPFGVYCDADGSKLPGAERGAWGEESSAIPYGRIRQWRAHSKNPP